MLKNHQQKIKRQRSIFQIVDGIIKVIDNPVKSSQNFNPENPNPDISSAPYRIYNIGNNASVQLLDFIEILGKSIGIDEKKNFMDMQDGDVVSTYTHTNDLIKDFDYKPDTRLADGIEQFVKWYKKFYLEDIK